MTGGKEVTDGRWPEGNRKLGIGRQRALVAHILAALLWLVNPGQAREMRPIDPSGQWQGQHGVLSLMRTDDALSFCYSAVFGATAHLCDAAGVAGLVADGEYHYVDGQGTVAFNVTEGGVTMRMVSGIASFCGANWPGDEFTRQGYKAVSRCTVAKPKVHFYVVKRDQPVERWAYVIKGDWVEAAPACFEGGDDWVLARFKGPKATTVGLLRKDDLECQQ